MYKRQVCYPAKLVHGHIEALLDMGITTIFYPCMTYNFDEGISDNHYNCPVVAYYPEVIQANVARMQDVTFIMDYVDVYKRQKQNCVKSNKEQWWWNIY